MSIASYSRGKTVYQDGSFAPNRGQVSAQGAQGYLQRELSKNRNPVSPVGKDGQSDQRSGVASAMLKRQTQNNVMSSGKITSTGGTSPTTTTTVTTGGGKPQGTRPPTTQPEPAAPAAPAMPPVINVNPQGVLELPFNYAYSQDVLNALGDYNQQLLDLQMESQDQAAQYATDKRNAGINYEGQKIHTLNDNASRGTARSSGYGLAVGRNAAQHTNLLNDIESQNTRSQLNADSRRAAIVSAFNQMLQRAALDYGNELVEDAGDLGYGTGGGNVPDPYTGQELFSGMEDYQYTGPIADWQTPSHLVNWQTDFAPNKPKPVKPAPRRPKRKKKN